MAARRMTVPHLFQVSPRRVPPPMLTGMNRIVPKFAAPGPADGSRSVEALVRGEPEDEEEDEEDHEEDEDNGDSAGYSE